MGMCITYLNKTALGPYKGIVTVLNSVPVLNPSNVMTTPAGSRMLEASLIEIRLDAYET